MLILATTGRPRATEAGCKVFIKLQSRNPQTGYLTDCAGFTLTTNEALMFCQELQRITLNMISPTRISEDHVARLLKFERP